MSLFSINIYLKPAVRELLDTLRRLSIHELGPRLLHVLPDGLGAFPVEAAEEDRPHHTKAEGGEIGRGRG